MNVAVVSGAVIAALSILGSIGSTLLLAYRVGKLTGDTEARVKAGEDDRANIWRALGILTGRYDKHIEHHSVKRRWGA